VIRVIRAPRARSAIKTAAGRHIFPCLTKIFFRTEPPLASDAECSFASPSKRKISAGKLRGMRALKPGSFRELPMRLSQQNSLLLLLAGTGEMELSL
jgi:hypothetical protein